jgi:hypothetical protein
VPGDDSRRHATAIWRDGGAAGVPLGTLLAGARTKLTGSRVGEGMEGVDLQLLQRGIESRNIVAA